MREQVDQWAKYNGWTHIGGGPTSGGMVVEPGARLGSGGHHVALADELIGPSGVMTTAGGTRIAIGRNGERVALLPGENPTSDATVGVVTAPGRGASGSAARQPQPNRQPQVTHAERAVRSEYAGPERLANVRTRSWVESTEPQIATRTVERVLGSWEEGPRRVGQELVWDVYRRIGSQTVTTRTWRERQVTETVREYATQWYAVTTRYRDTYVDGRLVSSEIVGQDEAPSRVTTRAERSVMYGPWQERTATDVGPLATRIARSERRTPVEEPPPPPQPQPQPQPQPAVKIKPVITIPGAAQYPWSNYSRYKRGERAEPEELDGDLWGQHGGAMLGEGARR